MGRDGSTRSQATIKNFKWAPPFHRAQRGNEGLEF